MSEICCETIEILDENVATLSMNTSGMWIFKIKLSTYHYLVPSLIEYLNAEELQRSQKYHFEKDSNRFVICRVLLKFILARYTGLDISKVFIEKDENKKPYLSIDKSCNFNVSHAEDFGIIAVSNNAVGVDVEYLNKNFDYSDILSHVFSSQEIETIINADNKDYTFYKFWTRKEAIVKATGKGISDSFSQIPVKDGYHSIASHLLDDFQNINVQSFDLHKDYVATIAYSDVSVDIEKLMIYSLPTSLEGLISFID